MKASQPSTRDQLERGVALVRRSAPFWRRALLVFVLGALVAVPYVFTRPRAYRSETVILYQETIRSTDLTGAEGGGENTARRVGARLREVLLSRATLEPIIKEMELYTKPGKALEHSELIEAVDEMRKAITFRAREGDTFEIAFVGSTPKQAQDVTTRLSECIIQEAATRRAQNAKTLKEFLDAESERNKTDLRQKEAELAKFAGLHPQLAARLQGAPGQVASAQPAAGTGTVDPVLASLEARAARIDRQLKAASSPSPAVPRPTFQPPPDGPELVAARRDLADKSARYTDKHPDVIAARNRLRSAEEAQATANRAALDAFNAQNAASLDPPPPRNATDEAALRRELAELYAQIAGRRMTLAGGAAARADAGAQAAALASGSPDVALEVEFRRLQREVNEGRERQHQLDEKLFKASITASSVMNDRNIQVSILDPAFLPTAPVSKSRALILGGLLALCFALAVATAIASAMLDDRIYDRMDLERLDVLPILGVVPRAQLPTRKDD